MELLLTKLKTIQPNKEFTAQSKALIFAVPQLEKKLLFSSWLLALPYKTLAGISAAAVLMLLGGLATFLNSPTAPALTDSLDQENLAQEARSLDIQIQLSQVQYYEESARKIEVALNEASDEYDSSSAHQKQLDELLNELTL